MTPRFLSLTTTALLQWLLASSGALAQESSSSVSSAPPPILVEFTVQLDANDDETLDSFQVEVKPDWAPIGAARFLELVDDHPTFFDQMRFFRVLPGFIAQFGITGDPQANAMWRNNVIEDDPVVQPNIRGTLSFAMAGENTRTTQMFINLKDNASSLDDAGFAPFARVTGQGMDVVTKLYGGYGEGAPDGDGPDQLKIQTQGNQYLESDFPLLSVIVSVERVGGGGGGTQTTPDTPPADPNPAGSEELQPSSSRGWTTVETFFSVGAALVVANFILL